MTVFIYQICEQELYLGFHPIFGDFLEINVSDFLYPPLYTLYKMYHP
jgi:hypothetical protein